MPYKKIFLPCLFFLLIVISCSKPTQYEKAKELYEKSLKDYGNTFYRLPEFKTVKESLESIPSDDPEYVDARALLAKITGERLEMRKENVKQMMERLKMEKDLGKLKAPKPYSEMPNE